VHYSQATVKVMAEAGKVRTTHPARIDELLIVSFKEL